MSPDPLDPFDSYRLISHWTWSQPLLPPITTRLRGEGTKLKVTYVIIKEITRHYWFPHLLHYYRLIHNHFVTEADNLLLKQLENNSLVYYNKNGLFELSVMKKKIRIHVIMLIFPWFTIMSLYSVTAFNFCFAFNRKKNYRRLFLKRIKCVFINLYVTFSLLPSIQMCFLTA